MSRKFSDVDIALPISVELRARRFPAEKNPTVFRLPASGDGRDEEPACFVLGEGEQTHNPLPHTPTLPYSRRICAQQVLLRTGGVNSGAARQCWSAA